MDITATHRFTASLDEVWAMFSDPDAHVAKFERMGHTDLEVLSQEAGAEALDLTIRRKVEIEVPSVAAKFISPSNTVTSTDHWQRDGDERLSGHYEVDIKGVPAETKGTTSVVADGDGCTYTVRLEVKVKVPLVGDRIAKALRPQLEAQLGEEFAAADAWLAR